MKKHPYWKMSAGLAVAALTCLGSVTAVQAASAPALTGSLTLRPLTPTEISVYKLTGAQVSAGLNNVALGEPVYVDTMVNVAIAPSNIVGVTWSLTAPIASKSTLLPVILGTNVPLYNTADRISGEASKPVYQLAGPTGRAFFRPDVAGSYTVNATITTVGSGSTNLSISIISSTYLGVQTCLACHSGLVPKAPNMSSFTNTEHASMFTRAIDGNVSSHYGKSCISCHTTGYDTNSFANNGGFDDVAATYGWSFPSVLTNGNWASMPLELQSLANINCENCHGPGYQHLVTSGSTNAITVNYDAGTCSQCHDSLSGHFKSAEWNNSLHSRSARQTGSTCVRCHTGRGFIGWSGAGGMAALNANPTSVIPATPDANYSAINCQACHDPHDASNPHQLRMGYNVTLSDGTTVTNAGSGGFCMECHNSRNGSYATMMANYPTFNGIDSSVTNLVSKNNWAGGSAFGTHDSPQADMLEGVNAETYGKVIPSAPHANVVSNTCSGCHMQVIASTDPAFTLAGGHTFKMSYVNTNGVTVPVTYVCAQCHGTITNFDMLVPDYAGVGQTLGIQTQVQLLLNKLSTLLPPKVYQSNPAKYVADGLVKTSYASYTNMPLKFLKAAYNYQFVTMDNSYGVHNAPFAVGLLKASIADLTGDANNDGLPDSWQIANFGAGFATNPAAAYNAVNNAAGIPNWMAASLGVSPFSGFKLAGNSGVVYVNNGTILNGDTNNIAIYKAAEVVFNTQAGSTYTIQGIDALTGGWQNISTNIPGTGSSVSYLTPTRQNTQMFFRVVHTP
jgi:nitrate reductase cytochrome c-type subunit